MANRNYGITWKAIRNLINKDKPIIQQLRVMDKRSKDAKSTPTGSPTSSSEEAEGKLKSDFLKYN